MSYNNKLRLFYAAAFLILLLAEILIAVFVHDSFVRPYLGDVIVVWVVYAFVRIFIPVRFVWLSPAVFVFSAGVELLQGIHIADLFGITDPVLRTIIGTSFDIKDILCYGAGCILLTVYELIIQKRHKRELLQD